MRVTRVTCIYIYIYIPCNMYPYVTYIHTYLCIHTLYVMLSTCRHSGLRECLTCPIANDLLHDVGAGRQHVADAVRYARSMIASGFDAPALQALAANGGESERNAERDLHRAFGMQYPVEPFFIPLTLNKREGPGTETVSTPTLAPYELFHALWAEGGQRQFALSLFPRGSESVPAYWKGLERSTWGRNHTVNSTQALRSRRHLVVPTVWHSDGAEIFSGTEFHIFSWSSALSFNGNVIDEKCCFWCWRKV